MVDAELRKEVMKELNKAIREGRSANIIAAAISLISRTGNAQSNSDMEEKIKTSLKGMSSEEIELLKDILTNANPEDNEKELSCFERLLNDVGL